MLAPINWLKDFVDINCPAEELAYKLTMSSFEIEQIIYPAKGIKGVVIGRIISLAKHPNADKLQICQIDVGDKHPDPLIIVTGATNIAPGDSIPVAMVGAILAGGFEIKVAKLRGEDSFGMLCSEKELGLADSAEGIMHLPSDAPIGEIFTDYLGLNDAILDISILPNRPDCMSILGVSREIAAVLGVPLRQVSDHCDGGFDTFFASAKNNQPLLVSDIKVGDPCLCPRYMGQVLTDIKVCAAPLWMQQRLRSAGIRPINNVVDVTNYILLEVGQPLHAFDLARLNLKDNQITIRSANNGEKLTTLDGVDRKLSSDNLVIADSVSAIALAGVMGGESSEITESTNRVFLESACFNPVSVRKTSQSLGLRSESSIRFERGVDWHGAELGLKRAIELLIKYADAKIAAPLIDVQSSQPELLKIVWRPERINKVLGMSLSEAEMVDCLNSLGFEIKENEIVVPSWRSLDVRREADIVEEIARIFGYDKLPATLPASRQVDIINVGPENCLANICNILQGHGLNEIVTYSLVSPDSVLGDTNSLVKLKNPLSQEESVLRSTLLPGLIKVIQTNMNRGQDKIALFELGKTYSKVANASPNKYLERSHLAGAIYASDTNYLAVKAVLENLFIMLKVSDLQYRKLDQNSDVPSWISDQLEYFHPGKTALINIGDDYLGYLGEFHPKHGDDYKFSEPVVAFDLDLELLQSSVEIVKYKAISKFPSTTQDIVFVVKKEISHAQIIETIKSNSNVLVESIKLFDCYDGEQVEDGYVSMGYSITYRDPQQTLVEKEVIKIHEQIARAVQEKLGAKFR